MPRGEYQISRAQLIRFIEHYGARSTSIVRNGFEYWMYEESVLIKIQKNRRYFDFEELEEIAISQMELSSWELDYWLGVNNIF